MSTCRPWPADVWLRETCADRNWLDEIITAAMNPCITGQDQPPNARRFGVTVERSVQLDQCRTVPGLRDLHGFYPTITLEMVRSLAYEPPAGRPTAPWSCWRRQSDEPVNRQSLHRVASCLAVYHFVARDLRKYTDADAVARRLLSDYYRSDRHLQHVTAEAPAFHAIMASYDRNVRPVLLGLGRAIASPSLPGKRTADLRIGQTIIEIKTGWLDDADTRQELYDQLLGYGLLSQLTKRPATHVAAYLARYGAIRPFAFPDLFHRCANRPTDIMEAAWTYYGLHERQVKLADRGSQFATIGRCWMDSTGRPAGDAVGT